MPLSDTVAPNPTVTAFPQVDTISLAGQTMPGRWLLVDATKVFGWQIQKGNFLSWATLLPTGDEIVAAKFEVWIWKQSDFAIFREVRKVLLKKPVFSQGGTLTSSAMGIDHPELKALGVTAVVVKSISPMVNDEFGTWRGTVEFYQWRRPKPAPPKPSTTIPDVVKPAPTAQDLQDVELQKLRAERQSLGAR